MFTMDLPVTGNLNAIRLPADLGENAVRSVLAFDYPAIQAVVLVIAAISLFVYLALDVIHAWIDPRLAS